MNLECKDTLHDVQSRKNVSTVNHYGLANLQHYFKNNRI